MQNFLLWGTNKESKKIKGKLFLFMIILGVRDAKCEVALQLFNDRGHIQLYGLQLPPAGVTMLQLHPLKI